MKMVLKKLYGKIRELLLVRQEVNMHFIEIQKCKQDDFSQEKGNQKIIQRIWKK